MVVGAFDSAGGDAKPSLSILGVVHSISIVAEVAVELFDKVERFFSRWLEKRKGVEDFASVSRFDAVALSASPLPGSAGFGTIHGVGDFPDSMLHVEEVQYHHCLKRKPSDKRANPLRAVAENDQLFGVVEAQAQDGNPDESRKHKPIP
jgi:hypothetical protein